MFFTSNERYILLKRNETKMMIHRMIVRNFFDYLIFKTKRFGAQKANPLFQIKPYNGAMELLSRMI